MTREELGITDEGEAYINAIIARGALGHLEQYPMTREMYPGCGKTWPTRGSKWTRPARPSAM